MVKDVDMNMAGAMVDKFLGSVRPTIDITYILDWNHKFQDMDQRSRFLLDHVSMLEHVHKGAQIIRLSAVKTSNRRH